MKSKLYLHIVLMLAPVWAQAQGYFVYDQQSGDESDLPGGLAGAGTSELGQSFVPALSSVGFIRLFLYDFTPGNTEAGSIALDLRSGSPSGPILGSTAPVLVPGGYSNTVNFFFPVPASVTPGNTYVFQLIGDSEWIVDEFSPYAGDHYPSGTAFVGIEPDPGVDLWFREGIFGVPEPSSVLLLWLGGGLLLYTRRAPHR